MGCDGSCSSCSGCGRELVLTKAEVDFLELLGQIPFLPVARRADSMEPVCLEGEDREQGSLVIQCLEKKGLVDLDYTQPLAGFPQERYQGYPIRGSLALTARGQQVLELIQYQGISENP